jgi:Mat/Ecp fimbriae major subunit
MWAMAFGRARALAAGILASVVVIPAPSGTAATGRASATILQAIVVVETAPMSFAAVAPPPGGGTIVLTPAGAISSPGGFAFRGTPVPGAFHARGAPNYPASVSLSTGNLVTGPGRAMQLAAFTGNVAPTFDGAANLTFAVGAALTINPNQTPGQYGGTYAVTVNY